MSHTVGREIYRAYHCKGFRNVFYTREAIDPTVRGIRPNLKKGEKRESY